MGNLAEWATCVVALISAYLILSQLKNDHERSRRQLATEMMFVWARSQKSETSSVRNFVRNLSLQECQFLVEMTPFHVSNTQEHINLLNASLEPKFSHFDISTITNGNIIKVEGQYLAHIRSVAIDYLNTLESILSAWHSGTASRKIIEEQFVFLRNLAWTSLPQFRNANQMWNSNVDPYPCITSFIAIANHGPTPVLGDLP